MPQFAEPDPDPSKGPDPSKSAGPSPSAGAAHDGAPHDGASQDTAPPHSVHVFEAEDFWAVGGVSTGDALDLAGISLPGDVFELDRGAVARRLLLARGAGRGQRVADGSDVGVPGAAVALVGRHVVMAPEGDTVDLLMLRIEGRTGLWVLPLSPVVARKGYTLIESHDDPGEVRLADLVCLAFAAGTMITLAGGAQRPIEQIVEGERVLTRDSGPQPVQLVARATLRAHGAFAPVVISAGTLGNAGDLVVAPQHRVFLYRRGDARIGARSELLVQARLLIDGERVWRREGGTVDYYALVFARHEIVYAEGIPVESLLVTETTLELLPQELAAEIRARLPDLRHAPHFSPEADADALAKAGPGAVFLRRRPEQG